MTRILSKIRLAATLPLAVAVIGFTPVVVYAEHGKASADTTTTSTSEPTETGDDQGTMPTTKDQAENEAHSKALTLLSEKRQTIKTHTAEQKQKACEARAASIKKRADNYAAAAQRHLDVFNSIFTKVKAFHDDKKLNVANYDALVATATTKQTAAQAAVDALKATDVTIDCTQADPATAVATLKTATSNARTALQDYRKAIKDVVVALKGASTSTTKDSNSSSSDNSTKPADSSTGGTQ